jgi:hypothetical protein
MQRMFFTSVAFLLPVLAAEPQPLKATVNFVSIFFRYENDSAERDTSQERRLFDFFRRHGLRLATDGERLGQYSNLFAQFARPRGLADRDAKSGTASDR